MKFEPITMVFDTVKMQPGCAIIQAMYGANYMEVFWMFDPGTWIVTPNENMRLIRGSYDDFKNVSRKINEEHKNTD